MSQRGVGMGLGVSTRGWDGVGDFFWKNLRDWDGVGVRVCGSGWEWGSLGNLVKASNLDIFPSGLLHFH